MAGLHVPETVVRSCFSLRCDRAEFLRAAACQCRSILNPERCAVQAKARTARRGWTSAALNQAVFADFDDCLRAADDIDANAVGLEVRTHGDILSEKRTKGGSIRRG